MASRKIKQLRPPTSLRAGSILGFIKSKKETASSPLAISIRADNSIWFHGKPTSLLELERVLKKEKALHPGDTPQLIPDKNAHFGTYQAVKNTLELCGFEQMDVVLQPQ